MEILKAIHTAVSHARKRYILIGGHALNVRGISRSTGDIDLMVERDDAPFWKELLVRLDYEVFHETQSFIQSKSKCITAWPIDLMLVSSETMTKALADSTSHDIFGPPVPVASTGSLIAMKVHALKYVDAARALKDQSDLLALLQQAGIPIQSETFRQICSRYGTMEIYERLCKIAT